MQSQSEGLLVLILIFQNRNPPREGPWLLALFLWVRPCWQGSSKLFLVGGPSSTSFLCWDLALPGTWQLALMCSGGASSACSPEWFLSWKPWLLSLLQGGSWDCGGFLWVLFTKLQQTSEVACKLFPFWWVSLAALPLGVSGPLLLRFPQRAGPLAQAILPA